MMKHLILLPLMFWGLSSMAWAEGQNYTLTIEGQTYDAAPGETVHAKLKSGATVDIAFDRKAFGLFSNNGFSFEYPSAMAVAESEVDKGITQYTVMTALGSLLVVQRYQDTHGANLIEFLLDEMTKDDKNLGALVKKQDSTLTLKNGQTLNGMKYSVKSGSDDVTFEAYGLDIGKGGLVAISRLAADGKEADKQMVEHFWKSLQIDKP